MRKYFFLSVISPTLLLLSCNPSEKKSDSSADSGMTQLAAADTGKNALPSSLQITPRIFSNIITSKTVVLVDFSATWCGPCRMLAPSLDEIYNEMGKSYTFLKVDADRDQPLCDSMNVSALPTLMIFKGGEIQWRNVGLVPKETVEEELKKVIEQ